MSTGQSNTANGTHIERTITDEDDVQVITYTTNDGAIQKVEILSGIVYITLYDGRTMGATIHHEQVATNVTVSYGNDDDTRRMDLLEAAVMPFKGDKTRGYMPDWLFNPGISTLREACDAEDNSSTAAPTQGVATMTYTAEDLKNYCPSITDEQIASILPRLNEEAAERAKAKQS